MTSGENGRNDIAIIGMSCRFPGGASTPDRYWDLLKTGNEPLSEIPKDRWQWNAQDNDIRFGHFLDDIEGFDAGFFGISPREAAAMDPQQRLMLELLWELFENAGIVPERLKGSRTGVFVGVMWNDFRLLHDYSGSGPSIHSGTGCSLNIVANRLSYAFDLMGPSIALDTSCSSSLVAIHLACQSIRQGESEMAIAGGVSLMLSPDTMAVLAKFGGLAPDGRCKSFDARADGFGRGEGGGAVLLKLLDKAQNDGDDILCVIRGSAVNQDGFSNGLTAPKQSAQDAVLTAACRAAEVSGSELYYVEAHGSGTPLGDFVEVQALGHVMGRNRDPISPLRIGSVKSCLGHLEAAGGIAGVIKVILALRNKCLPAGINFETPNPAIDFTGLGVKVVIEHEPIPESNKPVVAGISAFGWGGTNCHVIVQQYFNSRRAVIAANEKPYLFTLSAQSEPALKEYVRRIVMRQKDLLMSARDICHTVNHFRTDFKERLAIVADSADHFVRQMEFFSKENTTSSLKDRLEPIFRGRAESCGKTAFVFPGQGCQWFGMGRDMLQCSPVFAETITVCDTILRSLSDWSLIDYLHTADTDQLSAVDRVQPALFAVAVGLAEVWKQWGIRPDAVIGHSLGEVAAACVAGTITLEDSLKIVVNRSRLVMEKAPPGAMAATELSIEDATAFAAGYGDGLHVAVCNGANMVVLSGRIDEVEDALRRLEARRVFCSRVDVNYASHTTMMDGVKNDMMCALSSIVPCCGDTLFYSTVEAGVVNGVDLLPEYWFKNISKPVHFHQTIRRMIDDDYRFFIEVSPHPVLTMFMAESVCSPENRGVVTWSLRRHEPGLKSMMQSLGTLYVSGYPVDWENFPSSGTRVPLPNYPFQRRRYPLPRPSGSGGRIHIESSTEPGQHLFEQLLCGDRTDFYGRHRLGGRPVLSVGGIIDTVLSSIEQICAAPFLLTDISFYELIVVPMDKPIRIQVVVQNERWRFAVRREQEERWRITAHGSYRRCFNEGVSFTSIDPLEWCDKADCLATAIDTFQRMGISFTENYLPIDSFRREGEKAFAKVTGARRARLIDSLLMTTLMVKEWDVPPVVAAISSLACHTSHVSSGHIYAHYGESNDPGFKATATTEDDTVIAYLSDVRVAPHQSILYVEEWMPFPLEEVNIKPEEWLFIGSDTLCRTIRGRGDYARANDIQESDLSEYKGIILFFSDLFKHLENEDASRALHVVRANVIRIQQAMTARQLILVTHGVPWSTGERVAVDRYGIHGLVNVIAAERPDLDIRVIDIGMHLENKGRELFWRLLAHNNKNVHYRIYDDKCYISHLIPWFGMPQKKTTFNGVVLITGGFGDLGLRIAGWAHLHGASDIALIGRHPPESKAESSIVALQKSGAKIRTLVASVEDEAEMGLIFQGLIHEGQRVGSVFHVAGVVEDACIEETDGALLNRVLMPKVRGAWNLHRLTRQMDVDHFILFGSIGSRVGLPGQGAYATANSFLDGLAEYRRSKGLPAVTIDWCGWSRMGFSKTRGGQLALELLKDKGIESLNDVQALEVLDHILAADTPPQIVVMPQNIEDGKGSSEYQDENDRLREAFAATRGARKKRIFLREMITEFLSDILLLTPEEFDPNLPLKEQGLDSLMAVQLINRCNRCLHLAMPRTTIWQHPTIETLCRHITATLDCAESPPTDTLRAVNGDDHSTDLDSMLEEIEALSEDDAREIMSMLNMTRKTTP